MRSICLVPDRILGKDSITRLHHRHLIPWRRVFFVEYQLSLGKLIKCIRQKKSLLIYRTFFAECFLNTRQELSESAVPTTTSCGRHGVPWSNLSLLRAIGIEKKNLQIRPGPQSPRTFVRLGGIRSSIAVLSRLPRRFFINALCASLLARRS